MALTLLLVHFTATGVSVRLNTVMARSSKGRTEGPIQPVAPLETALHIFGW